MLAVKSRAKLILIAGVGLNLAVLGYYKYANFFVDNLNESLHLNWQLPAIILPIGISFFTFQKIAFLVDIYQGKVGKVKFLDYILFVSFFPQLIAGPITHHSEIIPQVNAQTMKPDAGKVQLGLTFFVIGLAKKVFLADTAATFASPAFTSAAAGSHLDFVTAWTAALAYTAQLYFDFSAYSDMAIGLGLLFGIRLPINFNSPYKSASIIEFWRRWHMTLSRFLRDYLYIPLGGNRKGGAHRYLNLLMTMVLGGIWHGAGWTFLCWGLLHGIYLTVNHMWRKTFAVLMPAPHEHFLLRKASQAATFLAVVVAWVFFRAPNVTTAVDILKSMAGGYGAGVAAGPLLNTGLLWTVGLLLITWVAPNTQQLTGYIGPESTNKVYEVNLQPQYKWQWRPSFGWAFGIGCLLGGALMMLSQISEFIYFQF